MWFIKCFCKDNICSRNLCISPVFLLSMLCAQIQEHHSQKHEEEVESLALSVLLVKDECSEEERNDYASAAHHAHDANHCSVEAEAVEVHKVGRAQEERDEDDAPVPVEWGSALALRIPQQQHHRSHHEELVDVVVTLYCHLVQSHAAVLWCSHQILVVQTAYCSEDVCQHHEQNPFVVLEVDAFLLSASAKHEERYHGESHANPLVDVQPLAKHEECAHEHHYRARGVYRAYNG